MSTKTKSKVNSRTEEEAGTLPKNIRKKGEQITEKLDKLVEEIDAIIEECEIEKIEERILVEERCACGFPLSECWKTSPEIDWSFDDWEDSI